MPMDLKKAERRKTTRGHSPFSLRYEPGNTREQPGREKVACNVRPECAGCGMAAHGFLCHFSDGPCLRCRSP